MLEKLKSKGEIGEEALSFLSNERDCLDLEEPEERINNDDNFNDDNFIKFGAAEVMLA